jgi:hypothetical protein
MSRLIVRYCDTDKEVGSKAINLAKLPTLFVLRNKMLLAQAEQLVARNWDALSSGEMYYVLVNSDNKSIAKGKL